jgi:hypothetical protein
MKKMIFILLVLVCSTTVFAQCDKILVLTSSKTDFLDASGTLKKSEDENTVIEIAKTEMTITPGGEENKMSGPVKSVVCNWKTAFKEGKTIIKAILTDRSGDAKDVTITIEGKDGKVTLLAEVDEMPDHKIKVTLDKFEEKT